MNTELPTAPLASGLTGAGGGAVDNPCAVPDSNRSRSTYLSPDRVQTSGATSVLAIALGAMAVSAFLVFAALAGLEQRMRFDASARLFTYWRRAPVLPAKSESWGFASIERVVTAVHTCSDGPDSYSVRVVVEDGRELTTGSTDSRADVDRYVARLNDLLQAAAS